MAKHDANNKADAARLRQHVMNVDDEDADAAPADALRKWLVADLLEDIEEKEEEVTRGENT